MFFKKDGIAFTLFQIDLLTTLFNLFWIINIKENIKLLNFRLCMLKRQQFFIYWQQNTVHYYVFSSRVLLLPSSRRFRFLGKSQRNTGKLIVCLKERLKNRFKHINFLSCKNFNFRQHRWLVKYFTLIHPIINYFILTHSWAFSRKKKRRIKKRILKFLLQRAL